MIRRSSFGPALLAAVLFGAFAACGDDGETNGSGPGVSSGGQGGGGAGAGGGGAGAGGGGAGAGGGGAGAGGGGAAEGGGGAGGSGGGETPDTTPPSVALLSPDDGAVVHQAMVTVTGTASDATAVASVTVNGLAAASSDGFATFSAEVPLVLGANTITVAASDTVGNSDAAAATRAVTLEPLDGPPVLDGVYPPEFVGFDAAAVTVYVHAADADGVASVQVGAVAATWDPAGHWVATGVPANSSITIQATDAVGQVATTTRQWNASSPYIGPFWVLATEPDGRLVGWVYGDSFYRYDPYAAPRAALLSGHERGIGPAIGTVYGMTVIGAKIYVGADNGIFEIDRVSGDRTQVAGCSFPSAGPFTAVAGAPIRLFRVHGSAVYQCDIGDATATYVADLPFSASPSIYAPNLAYDSVGHRVVAGDAASGEVAAVDLDDGSGALLQVAGGGVDASVRGLTVLAGQPYFMTYGNLLRRTTADLAGETLAYVGSNYPFSITTCPSADTPMAVCVQSSGGSRMYRVSESAGTWTPAAIAFDNLIGSGLPIDADRVIVVPNGPGFATEALYTDAYTTALVRLDLATGVRSATGVSWVGNLSKALPSGTVVTSDGRMFDAHAPAATIHAVPGGPLGAQLDVVPAQTLLAEEAVAYLKANAGDPNVTELRLRGLSSAADTLVTTFSNVWVAGIATASDGTIYAGMQGELYVVPPGAASATLLLGGLPQIQSGGVYYEDTARTVTVGYGGLAIVQVDTSTVTYVSTSGFDLSVSPWIFRPGPVPGTVIAADFFLDRSIVSVDWNRSSAYLLAR
ncbi:MAG: hypothetical protein IT373_18370 [Polyangiaceae bacterium]|nr:hypothetical protein [Polyangiaceae bacterium]